MDDTTEATVDAAPEVELTANDVIKAQLAPPKAVNKPDISRLKDALSKEGRPLYVVGDRIIIERYGTIGGRRLYLDTRTYRVDRIDEASGNVWLFDLDLGQHAGDNFRSGPRGGNVYKFAAGTSIAKKKRGRPRKNPVEEPKPPEKGPDGAPVKKKRGRPPGVKNRSKGEIRAEKAQKDAARAAKLQAKKKRGKGV